MTVAFSFPSEGPATHWMFFTPLYFHQKLFSHSFSKVQDYAIIISIMQLGSLKLHDMKCEIWFVPPEKKEKEKKTIKKSE